MQPITYSLKNQQKHSDQFFHDLSDFTDVVLAETQHRIGALIADFQGTLGKDRDNQKRTPDELAFDALVLGVLWRVYAPQVEKLAGGHRRILGVLFHARSQSRLLKPMADFLRGLIGGVAFTSNRHPRTTPNPSLEGLSGLINWMGAVGEFEEEIRRLEVWKDYLSQTPVERQQEWLENIVSLAGWFEDASREVLGNYTPNVETFLAQAHPGYRWREDFIFTGRQRVEYHLNMVGTEIMNRSFRAEFLRADRKLIFVPPCMAAPKDGKCQATGTPYGERCAGCTPTCQVHQVTKLAEKLGIEVFMIPDSFSPLASSDGAGLEHARVGVVGVSCPLTIVSGGYEMKRMGIPAQGLILDHCGCSWHWDPGGGIVTEINMRQLKGILDDRVEPRD